MEVEQRIWCFTEELQKQATIIHTQENLLVDLSKQHDAEKQKYTQKVHESHSFIVFLQMK